MSKMSSGGSTQAGQKTILPTMQNPQQETIKTGRKSGKEKEEDLAVLWESPKRTSDKPGSKTAGYNDLTERLPGGSFRLRVEMLKHQETGLTLSRHFTREGVHPYDEIAWEKRTAKITNDRGEAIFEQDDLEFPKSWSQLATNVVVSKYFRSKLGEGLRESSLKELIDRVVLTIGKWGFAQGYFATENDLRIFQDELTYLLVNQYGAFNSPVWFNVGQEDHPQCSACFINAVQDTMESILELAKTEGMLFKFGSGTGTNLSTLRSSREHLSTGGIASGPVSFMRGYDSFAGVIKSGGKTRRAAKMVIMNVDHPDIMDFIEAKVREERKAWALIEAGYGGGFDGEAYTSVFFQNSNNSVRVTDEFMRKVKDNDIWYTKAVTSGKKMDTYQARDVMRKIADAAHVCGDPGLQFDTTINRWNPCQATVRINASNPCSEYMFADDSACNLASLNVMAFRGADGSLDVEGFKQAVDIFITAQEIIVDNASYPRQPITVNSHLYRPLGLGYTNLGAVLMRDGIAYDSDKGRAYASALTALMTGRAYEHSARMAKHFKPFRLFEKNANSFMSVMEMHRDHLEKIHSDVAPADILEAAKETWNNAIELGEKHGYRNAQVSVIAPTGTISLMMDCDTTGIEPDLALIKYKKFSGGGGTMIVNNSVAPALRKLGYSEEEIVGIQDFIMKYKTIEGAPGVKSEHLPVFDCALKSEQGTRVISPMGHVRMMAATQPFISGAISKTVNLPEETTVEEIMDTYLAAWELGLKSIAVYRSNSKRTQPLTVGTASESKGKVLPLQIASGAQRRKLPDERRSITHKFNIAGHEGYITVGMYEDDSPGEIFLVMSKEGSTISGLLDGFATVTSLALQYGVPLSDLASKFAHTRFDPAGPTPCEEVPFTTSIYDYIFRWLASKFLSEEERMQLGNHVKTLADHATGPSNQVGERQVVMPFNMKKSSQEDAPICPRCGMIMTRAGSCHTCLNCGTQHGCS